MQTPCPLILVVDDDPAVCRLLGHVLTDAGYAVESAADGPEALARLASGDVDLVLLDIMLPEMDGLEICRRVRSEQNEVYLPIIMLTALAGEDQVHAGFEVGADDYVTKPFAIATLLDRVQVWLRTRQRL
jgi:DNA-binding response OmpR family regulator